MNKSCALSGHRFLPRNFDREGLYDALEELIQEGYDNFYCGMAMGFDLLALDCLLSLRQRYPIFIEACVPFRGQEEKFPATEKRRYREMLPMCDKVTVICIRYFDGCYLLRNRYMVRNSDLLFAYCTKDKGGTAYTVKYAEEHGKEVKLLT